MSLYTDDFLVNTFKLIPTKFLNLNENEATLIHRFSSDNIDSSVIIWDELNVDMIHPLMTFVSSQFFC